MSKQIRQKGDTTEFEVSQNLFCEKGANVWPTHLLIMPCPSEHMFKVGIRKWGEFTVEPSSLNHSAEGWSSQWTLPAPPVPPALGFL